MQYNIYTVYLSKQKQSIMKTLEQLLEDYNKESETNVAYYYNDLNGFKMWLGFKGYRLNSVPPSMIDTDTNRANDFINSTNLILTSVNYEFELIQLMQDKGLTFSEMTSLTLRMQNKLNELKK